MTKLTPRFSRSSLRVSSFSISFARADRRDDDRHRLDDRVWHLYHLGGIVATERRAGLAAAGMGCCRFAHHHRRVVLLGACDHDAARRRRLRFPARSIRNVHRVFVWLDAFSCDSDRDYRCGSDRVRKISRRFCHSSLAGQLRGGADLVGSLRDQLVTGTTGRDRLDRAADVEQHARA